ncbi:MAG: hypothetical protein ACHREM_00170 [Polyangiales bacterium]
MSKPKTTEPLVRSLDDFYRIHLPRAHARRTRVVETPAEFGARLARELVQGIVGGARPRKTRRVKGSK